MGQPIRHHFLPVFYLSNWATTLSDGQLVQFSKPYRDIVKPKRVHPRGRGYVDRLYAVDGLPDELAQAMEVEFLSPVDSRAAAAMTMMMEAKEISPAHRLAWAAFTVTLLTRMPEDIRMFKQTMQALIDAILPKFERLHKTVLPNEGPETFAAIADEAVSKAKLHMMDKIRKLMSIEKLVTGIASMEWSILTMDGAKHELLTSDRPVFYTNELSSEASYLSFALGPRHLFIAARRRSFIENVKNSGTDKIALAANSAVVGAADRYVYGSTDHQLRFIQNRMGSGKAPTIIERVRDTQMQVLFESQDEIARPMIYNRNASTN